ncbi:MAG: DUF2232 domain-containing protein [Candidatus Riflebacteria bacterium]|nr:DUF2232 domain-containing protein [Candidatus Riflebacteria bacterium]
MIEQTLAGRTLRTGMMAGVTLAGIFLAGYLPMFGGLLLAMAGIPALLVLLGQGAIWFLLFGVLTLVTATVWNGWPSAVLLIPIVLAPAATLAWTIKNGLEGFRAISVTLVLTFTLSITLWMVAPVLGELGVSLWSVKDAFVQQGRAMESQIAQLTKSKDIDQAALNIVREQFHNWIDFVAMLIPWTFVFLWHLLSTGVLYLGGVYIGPRYGVFIPSLPRFSTWRFEWHLIWLFIAGWALFYGDEYFVSTGFAATARAIGANCLVISKTLYFILGLSLLASFFEIHQVSRPNRIGLSFLALIFNQLLVWLGIMDVWLDFRAPKDPSTPKRDESDDEGSFFD